MVAAVIQRGIRPLIVLVLAVAGWTMTWLADTLVALAAALALAGAGVLTTEQLFATLGHELIWLLLAPLTDRATSPHADP